MDLILVALMWIFALMMILLPMIVGFAVIYTVYKLLAKRSDDDMNDMGICPICLDDWCKHET